jgi:hypothetical protein
MMQDRRAVLAYEARQQREVTTKGSECSIPMGHGHLDHDAQMLCLSIPATIDLGGRVEWNELELFPIPHLRERRNIHAIQNGIKVAVGNICMKTNRHMYFASK